MVSNSLPLAQWSSVYFSHRLKLAGFIQCAQTVLRKGITGVTAADHVLDSTEIAFVQNIMGAEHPDMIKGIVKLLQDDMESGYSHDQLFGLGSNLLGQLGANPIPTD